MILQIILESVIRSIFAYILLLVLTRLMGRKSIGKTTFFDFIVAITCGSITASLAISQADSVYAATAALITFTVMNIIVDFLHMKNFKFYKLVESEPVVIIENGKINNENMRKIRFNIEDLTTLLREKNVFNIADVEFAVLENDGQLSVLLKSQKQPLTPADMKLPTEYIGLTKDIIMDGRIMSENLEDIKLDETWLYQQLFAQGIKDASQVFYAGIDTCGKLYVSVKRKTKEKHGEYGIE